MAEITFKVAVFTSSVDKITFVVVKITFTVAVSTSLVAKISFVVDEITFKVVVITYLVFRITFVVAEITFKVAMVTSSEAKITFVVAEIMLKWLWSLLRWSKSLLKNGSTECKSNNKKLYYIRLTWARSPTWIKNVGNCSNGGIKKKLGALLYISSLAESKYYESMLKPLIVTFKDVGIFF